MQIACMQDSVPSALTKISTMLTGCMLVSECKQAADLAKAAAASAAQDQVIPLRYLEGRLNPRTHAQPCKQAGA